MFSDIRDRSMDKDKLEKYLQKGDDELYYILISEKFENQIYEKFKYHSPYVPDSVMKGALDTATQIKDEFDRAEALTGLAPYLPESMMKEALDVATQIRMDILRQKH